MRLQEFFPIVEMLATMFDSISWQVQEGKDIGEGTLGKLRVQLIIEPISYHELRGLNLIFKVWTGSEFSELTASIETQQAASLIGAVTNAFKTQVKHYTWDFLMLVAKDNLQARSKLYTRIADRICREGQYNRANKLIQNSNVIVIGVKPLKLQAILDGIQLN